MDFIVLLLKYLSLLSAKWNETSFEGCTEYTRYKLNAHFMIKLNETGDKMTINIIEYNRSYKEELIEFILSIQK